jgi:hypothetical protein
LLLGHRRVVLNPLFDPLKFPGLKTMKSKFASRAAIATLAFACAGVPVFGQEVAPIAKAEPVARAQPVLKAQPSASEAAKENVGAKPAAVRPLSIDVELLSGTRIEGTLTDKNSLEMQTSFGSAEIPLSEVAGIKFASAEDSSTTVVMLNGDSITGATDIKMITVETEWGVAEINGPNITSILFVPNLAWNPESGLNGKRWKLLNTKPEAKAANTTGTQNQGFDNVIQGNPSNGNTFSPPQFGQPQPVFRSR